jgi:hypothetical protein
MASVSITENCIPVIEASDERLSVTATVLIQPPFAGEFVPQRGAVEFEGVEVYVFSPDWTSSVTDKGSQILNISIAKGTLDPKGRCALHQDHGARGGSPVGLNLKLVNASAPTVVLSVSGTTALHLKQ